MNAHRKIYVALPDRLLSVIERERASAELRDGGRVSRDEVITAMLEIAVALAGDEE